MQKRTSWQAVNEGKFTGRINSLALLAAACTCTSVQRSRYHASMQCRVQSPTYQRVVVYCNPSCNASRLAMPCIILKPAIRFPAVPDPLTSSNAEPHHHCRDSVACGVEERLLAFLNASSSPAERNR
jgi:hypothetical protein